MFLFSISINTEAFEALIPSSRANTMRNRTTFNGMLTAKAK